MHGPRLLNGVLALGGKERRLQGHWHSLHTDGAACSRPPPVVDRCVKGTCEIKQKNEFPTGCKTEY